MGAKYREKKSWKCYGSILSEKCKKSWKWNTYFNLTRKNVKIRNNTFIENETFFGNFQALCGNAEIVRIGDEQKQGWIIELSLVFFSSTAAVGYVKFQMDFIHPSFRVWINTSTLDFSLLKKNDKRWSRGIVLEFRSTIALSTIQMKAFAVLPSSPFFCAKNEIETIFQILKYFSWIFALWTRAIYTLIFFEFSWKIFRHSIISRQIETRSALLIQM